MTGLIVVGLLAAGAGQMPDPGRVAAAGQASPAAPVTLTEGDIVDLRDDGQVIRGRIAALSAEVVELDAPEGRLRFPVGSVRQIDRVGDGLADGAAVGGAVAGGLALGLMAKLCANANCADTSANLDPRVTLLATVMGAGVGALIDAAIDRRQVAFQSGSPLPVLRPAAPVAQAPEIVVFARAGGGGVMDDEGSLGSGPALGGGVLVSFRERFGVLVTYDRHTRSRDFDHGGGFFGTEQVVSAKALFSFRPGSTVRPYIAAGLGLMDSKRRSDFPTFTPGPGGPIVGPPEVLRYRSRGAAAGFGAGLNVRVSRRFSVLGDVTLDLGGGSALGSTRFSLGAGWRF